MLTIRWITPAWRKMGRTKRKDWSGLAAGKPPKPQMSLIVHVASAAVMVA